MDVPMRKGLNAFFNAIDAINDRAGKIFSTLIVVIMVITAFEVTARYVFNHPTTWVWPLDLQLFAVLILFAGIYSERHGKHIRLDLFYAYYPKKMKRIARLVTLACMLLFLGVLIWQGSWMGWNSLKALEKDSGAFAIPLYPVKALLPLAGILFLLQGIVDFFRDRY